MLVGGRGKPRVPILEPSLLRFNFILSEPFRAGTWPELVALVLASPCLLLWPCFASEPSAELRFSSSPSTASAVKTAMGWCKMYALACDIWKRWWLLLCSALKDSGRHQPSSIRRNPSAELLHLALPAHSPASIFVPRQRSLPPSISNTSPSIRTLNPRSIDPRLSWRDCLRPLTGASVSSQLSVSCQETRSEVSGCNDDLQMKTVRSDRYKDR